MASTVLVAQVPRPAVSVLLPTPVAPPAHRSLLSAFGPLLAAERGLGWGKKVVRPYGRFPSSYPLATDATPSLGGVFLALGHDFCTENPASTTLSSTPTEPCHRLFTFFLLAISMTYAPGALPARHPSRILVRGPESGISEG